MGSVGYGGNQSTYNQDLKSLVSQIGTPEQRNNPPNSGNRGGDPFMNHYDDDQDVSEIQNEFQESSINNHNSTQ